MEAAPLGQGIPDRLIALRQRGDLAARADASCAALIAKLQAPVRITLFGLPGSGKRRVFTALSGLAIETPPDGCPTIEVSHGPKAATMAMLADGSTLRADGAPSAALMSQLPVFVQVTLPAAAIHGRRVLLVATEARTEDMLAGMRWAAPRSDLALWCSAAWTEAERRVWHAAPESLRNHAILVSTDRARMLRDPEAEDFDALFECAGQDGEDGLARVLSHVDETIEEAGLHDLHAAQMFLQRYDTKPDHPAPPHPAPPVAKDTSPPSVRHTTASPAPSEATAELARLFQAVRTAAGELMHHADNCQTGDANGLLIRFEATFEALADRVAGFDNLQDAWPELAVQVTQAHDLALLLRIEGGSSQLADAARLLVQVRYDIEERLAA